MTPIQTIMKAIGLVSRRREIALQDKSFYLRVNTWLTAGDGRTFCVQAPDDIEKLSSALKIAVEALRELSENSPTQQEGHTGIEMTCPNCGKNSVIKSPCGGYWCFSCKHLWDFE